jgi:hypothetical protein
VAYAELSSSVEMPSEEDHIIDMKVIVLQTNQSLNSC